MILGPFFRDPAYQLGPPEWCPVSPLVLGEGSLTKIDYRKRGTLIQTSLLEDLASILGYGEATMANGQKCRASQLVR